MTSQTDTSPEQAWIDAQGQATANSAQQTVTVQPDDTLTRIANSHGYTVDAVEAANPQITYPNLIFAGETVYLPTTVPPQKVTAQPDDNLTRIANSHGYTVDAVETTNPQITNPNLIFAGETVYLPTTVRPQVVKGVDNSEVQPIITDMANANAADQAVQAAQDQLRHPVSDRAARQQALQSLKDAREASAQAWNTVQQDTFKMLMMNNAFPYADQTAAAQVQQLNALEPGNAKFAAANDGALEQANQQWAQLGITKAQLKPIVDDYNKAQQDKNALDNELAKSDPDPRKVAKLTADEHQASDALEARIEATLTDVANRAGSDPAARSEAVMISSLFIQAVGPQDPAFQTAVDKADYDLQVAKPAAEVAAAYKKGGALAAADKLKTVTQNAGNAYYASQIIQASASTIDEITAYMGSAASNLPAPAEHYPALQRPEFKQIYADLSQSVDAGNKITISGSGPDTKLTFTSGEAATALVAKSIAHNAPTFGQLSDGPFALYVLAARDAVSNGDGVALTLATAAALKQQGNSDLAANLMAGAKSGLNGLQSKTQSDAAAFATTTDTINQLQATWGPFMSDDQLAKATAGYLADHPQDVVQKANDQLKSISRDGDAIAEAQVALQTYGPRLAGITGQSDLSAAGNALIGDNASVFAVLQSNKMKGAIIASALGPSVPSLRGGGTALQAFLASPAWRVPRTARLVASGVIRVANAGTSRANVPFHRENVQPSAMQMLPPLRPPFGPGINTGLAFGALLLVAGAGYGALGQPPSAENTALEAYAAMGLAIFGSQTAAGVIQLGQKPGTQLTGLKAGVVDVARSVELRALIATYFSDAALVNFLGAYNDISNNPDGLDKANFVFDSLQGLGNVANGSRFAVPRISQPYFESRIQAHFSRLQATFSDAELAEMGYTQEGIPAAAAADAAELGELVGLGGGIVAVLAAIGIAAVLVIRAGQETAAFQVDSSKFLQDGLGLNPGLASILTAPYSQPGSQSEAAAALLTYEHDHQMQPGQLLHQLNEEPVDKALQFLNANFNLGGPARIQPEPYSNSNGGTARMMPAPQPAPQPAPPP